MMSPVRRLNDRHPFEMYLLSLALFTSAPGAVGITDPPASVTALMPGWPARVWVVGLAAGCVVTLIGLAWHRPPFPLLSVTGLLLEQVGLVVVGCSTLFYVTAAFSLAGLSALVPCGIVLAFGLASFAQARKIQRILATSRSTT